jgi:hypothetical protein
MPDHAQNAVNSSDRPTRLVGEVGNARPRDGFEQFGRRSRDLIYIATPGGESDDPDSTIKNGKGIIVLDAKAHYAFVKRIPLQSLPAPLAPEEVSAMMADPVTNLIYIQRGRIVWRDRQGFVAVGEGRIQSSNQRFGLSSVLEQPAGIRSME